MKVAFFNPFLGQAKSAPGRTVSGNGPGLGIDFIGLGATPEESTKRTDALYGLRETKGLDAAAHARLMRREAMLGPLRGRERLRGYDVVFTLSSEAALALSLAKKMGMLGKTKLVEYTFTTREPGKAGQKSRAIRYGACSAIVVLSSMQVDDIHRVAPTLPVHLFRCGVDMTYWDGAFARPEELPFESGSYFLCAGDAGRDEEMVIELARRTRARFVRIARSQKTLDRYARAFAEEPGLAERLVLLSRVSAERLRNVYANARATVIPLLQEKEPWGMNVVLESLGCGTPVVVNHDYTATAIEPAEMVATTVVPPGLDAMLKAVADYRRPEFDAAALRAHLVENRSLASEERDLLEIARRIG